eukprot:2355967-Rhodomonas_salina.4
MQSACGRACWEWVAGYLEGSGRGEGPPPAHPTADAAPHLLRALLHAARCTLHKLCIGAADCGCCALCTAPLTLTLVTACRAQAIGGHATSLSHSEPCSSAVRRARYVSTSRGVSRA